MSPLTLFEKKRRYPGTDQADSTLLLLAIPSKKAAILSSISLAMGGFLPYGLHMTMCQLYSHATSFEVILTDGSLRQWVALKIMTAEMTVTSREIRWYDALGECHPGSLSSHYIAQLLDKFTTDGPNGKHLCLVFELLGPNVRSIVKSEYKDRTNIDPVTILRMTQQVLKALTFVHQSGFAHGGMINYQLVSGLV